MWNVGNLDQKYNNTAVVHCDSMYTGQIQILK